ncbi:MAG: sigma-54 dependent transcriptional regulator [Hyphomicrobiales bacterium]
MTERILIVDDDPIQRRLLEEAVKRFGYQAIVAEGGEPALKMLQDARGEGISLMVLDLVMPDLDGMGVLGRLKEKGINLPVIVQTAHGGIDTVVSAMRAGAFDFVVKPVSPERLQVSIANALKVNALEGEVARLTRRATGTLTFRDLATKSPAMARVISLGERAAKSNIPILIEGESGVGKEVIARAIQGSSDRRAKPFVTVNCGAIPDNLVESILFGHEKGAFTGATEKHIGKFQEAHGGTLFLDEVGELPLDVQVKLLRAIQEGEIDPIGARKPVRVDFRLISATNKSLLEGAKNGSFREDLYYRLNVFPVWMPPLRERREDIPELVRHFVARFAAEEGKRKLVGVRADAMQLLTSYDWPGNIRQLENALFRAVVLCDGSELTVEEFPQIAAQVEAFAPRALIAGISAPARAGEAPAVPGIEESLLISAAPPAAHYAAPLSQPTPAETYGSVAMVGADGEMRPLAEIEEAMIRFAIDHYQGRMSEVARRLGIGRSTLYRKLKEFGIDDTSATLAAE